MSEYRQNGHLRGHSKGASFERMESKKALGLSDLAGRLRQERNKSVRRGSISFQAVASGSHVCDIAFARTERVERRNPYA